MKRLASILIILILLCCNIGVFAKNDPAPGLQSIALSDSGLYAAVGYDGFIITSGDGISWSKRVTQVVEKLNAIAWGMGKFVAVGDKGITLTSADGISWTKANIGTNIDIYGVASSGKEFVVAGNDGTILVSKDGETWKQIRMATAERIYRIRWVNNRYIAIGGGMLILTSTDGITWDEVKSVPSSTIMFTDVAWSGDRYLVVGDHLNIWSSSDGITWTENEKAGSMLKEQGMDIDECIYSVVWAGKQFFAAGHRGNIVSSADGYDWHKQTNTTRRTLSAIVYSKDKFVAVGDDSVILNSNDGVSWNNLNVISVQSNEMNLKVGDQKPIMITVRRPYGDTADITADSLFEVIEGKNILTVENSGIMKAVGEGQARIRATYDYKSLDVLVSIEPNDNSKAGENHQTPARQGSEVKRPARLSDILLIVGAIIAVLALTLAVSRYKKRDRK